MKILLIEDSERIRKSLCTAFDQEGFIYDSSADGEEGLWYGLNERYDVVVLDIMLPSMDGLEILERWRAAGMECPVLLLTAKSGVPDRVRGFQIGADDYLIKPFAIEELLERIRALSRRSGFSGSETIKHGTLQVDMRSKTVFCDGSPVHVTPKEFRLLEVLLRNRGKVLSRSEIESAIFDSLAEPSSNVVDVTIASIRRKLRQAGASDLLSTRRGHGYYVRGEG